jgi:hypothetical protein
LAGQFCSEVATPAGFEPATFCFEGSCSIQLSYGAVLQAHCRMSRGAFAIADALEYIFTRASSRLACQLLDLIRLPRDRFAIRRNNRRKNHRSASIFAAKEIPL